MFLFGTPEDRAAVYLDNARRAPGMDAHYEEMDNETLKSFLANLRGVVAGAYRAKEDQEVIEILAQSYDEVFAYCASIYPELRDVVKRGIHQIPGPKTKERTSYYRKLAGVA